MIKVYIENSGSTTYIDDFGAEANFAKICGIKQSSVRFFIDGSLYRQLMTYIIDDPNQIKNKILLKFCNNIPQSKLKEHNFKRAIKEKPDVSVIYGSYWSKLSTANTGDKLISVPSCYNIKEAVSFDVPTNSNIQDFIGWINEPFKVIIEDALIAKLNSLEKDPDEDYIKLIEEYLNSDDASTKQLGWELLAKLDFVKYRRFLGCLTQLYRPNSVHKSKEIKILLNNIPTLKNYNWDSAHNLVKEFNEYEQKIGFELASSILKHVVYYENRLDYIKSHFNIDIKYDGKSIRL